MVFWEIYFWVSFFFLGLWHFNHGFSQSWDSPLIEMISVAMTAVALAGVWAFGRRVKVGGRVFWRIFFTTWCVWMPYYYVTSQITSRVNIAPYVFCFFIGEWAALLGVITIMGVALHHYAFNRGEIWE